MSQSFPSPTYCGIKHHNVDSGMNNKPSQWRNQQTISSSFSLRPFCAPFIYINKPLQVIKYWEETNKSKEGNQEQGKKRSLLKGKFKIIILNKIPENIVSIKPNYAAMKKEKPESQKFSWNLELLCF